MHIRKLIDKYHDIIMYMIFGLLTTLVNVATYYLLFNIFNIPNIAATVIAWILAVSFAFITNKLWVFESKSFDRKTLYHEVPTFFCARILTGIFDVAVMYFAVDLCHWDSTIWKLISNVIVIILNYIASKLVIFKKKETKQ